MDYHDHVRRRPVTEATFTKSVNGSALFNSLLLGLLVVDHYRYIILIIPTYVSAAMLCSAWSSGNGFLPILEFFKC